jgi:hypothetical protein
VGSFLFLLGFSKIKIKISNFEFGHKFNFQNLAKWPNFQISEIPKFQKLKKKVLNFINFGIFRPLHRPLHRPPSRHYLHSPRSFYLSHHQFGQISEI